MSFVRARQIHPIKLLAKRFHPTIEQDG